jgi:hypothetical protein
MKIQHLIPQMDTGFVQARRAGIFVDDNCKTDKAPSGATSSEYAAPTGLEFGLDFGSTKMPHLRRYGRDDLLVGSDAQQRVHAIPSSRFAPQNIELDHLPRKANCSDMNWKALFLLVPLMCGLCNATAEQVTNEPVKIFEKTNSNDQSIKVMHEIVKPILIKARETNYYSSGAVGITYPVEYIHVYKFVLTTNSTSAGIELWRKEMPDTGDYRNSGPIKIMDLFKDKERLIIVYMEGTSAAGYISSEFEVHCSVVQSFFTGDAECKDTVLFNDIGMSKMGRVTAANIYQNITNGALCVKLEGVKGSIGTFTTTGESVK